MTQANQSMLELAEQTLARVSDQRPRVYLSGPISKGDRNQSLYNSLWAQEQLIKEGFAVFNPMLHMLCPFNTPLTGTGPAHDAWMENDLPWVAVSDVLLRLEGESLGKEIESHYAICHGVKVYSDIWLLISDFREGRLVRNVL